MSELVARDVVVEASGARILFGVSFSAPAGTVTGLIGPNGAGKSTLIGAAIGLRMVTAGHIGFDGSDLPRMRAAERARIVAHVEQSASTSERLTVRDVVALGRIPFQASWQSTSSTADGQTIERAIVELGLEGLATRLYHTLSGGEQQRVQLARALAQEPRLLLLDEPTSHLDIQAQMTVLELLRGRARAGVTVLVAMHDLNLAARFCDRLVLMHRGRVAAAGPPRAVLTPSLLLDVYGVDASVLDLPGLPYPLVVYDRAAQSASVPKAD